MLDADCQNDFCPVCFVFERFVGIRTCKCQCSPRCVVLTCIAVLKNPGSGTATPAESSSRLKHGVIAAQMAELEEFEEQLELEHPAGFDGLDASIGLEAAPMQLDADLESVDLESCSSAVASGAELHLDTRGTAVQHAYLEPTSLQLEEPDDRVEIGNVACEVVAGHRPSIPGLRVQGDTRWVDVMYDCLPKVDESECEFLHGRDSTI